MCPSPDPDPAPGLPPTDPAERRARLATRANPAPRLDYRVTLGARLAAGPGVLGGARVVVDYVPDRLLLDPEGFNRYINGLSEPPWPGPEALGVAILDDMNNEVVPRWLRVTVHVAPDGDTHPPGTVGRAPEEHRVVLEDRQPYWDEATGAGLDGRPGSPRRE
ncbi:hypothetical protein [Roseospira visakhapatnamensis]|uniref:Uncharacterized protein n=1 Tax=Roseospira visakhapatnamensis TaxID=390880 RepID=A0A7W6W8U9_9PROT|nr:hypothetical protein [Roseospira visakhapatnamensis]MBB4265400.1 hypothetical protein [Roseospira visakhapatnamensis]